MGLFSRRARGGTRSYVFNPNDQRVRAALKEAIVASAFQIDTPDEAKKLRMAVQPWQLEALGYRHRLGEIRYASDFYARPLRRLRFYVGEIQDDGTIQETKNAQVQAVLAAVSDPGGGTQNLLTQYGRLMFCTGEALLTYIPTHEVEGRDGTVQVVEEAWQMLSTAELRPQPDGTMIRYPMGATTSESYPLPEGSRVYRLWQRDTMFSELADAPMRAVLDLCEELVILTLVVRARSLNRLAGNGILFVPTEINLANPAEQTGPVPDEDMQEDPLFSELIKMLLASIEDLGAPSTVAPLLLRGPAEAGAEIRHITVRDAEEVFPENELRKQTIERLAIGLDMPAESLTGVAKTNHWNAWQIERDAWRHAEPIAMQYVNDMTAAYLRPALAAEGIANPERYVVQFDPSAIITNPDRGEDANDAFDRGAIGYATYRMALGWNDDDAPTEDELALMMAFRGQKPFDADAAEGAEEDAETGPPDADESEPDGTEEEPEAPEDAASARLVAALMGAAEMAVLRHREVAGARIRTKAGGCDECKERIAPVGNGQVAATLGYEGCDALGASDAEKLVAGREQPFAAAAARLGVPAPVSAALAQLVEHHAARTLFDAHPQPFPESALVAVLERRR